MTDHKSSWVPGILAILLTVMAAAAALIPYFEIIPQENMTLLTQAQTTLWAGWLMMLGYYFGSTSNSKSKDETIGSLAKTAQAGAVMAAADIPKPTDGKVILEPGDEVKVAAVDPPTGEGK